MGTCLLEVCVDDAAGLEAAIAGGADRIELCSALSVGGLTPLPGLMALAANAPVPVYAMIRPRSGDFVFSSAEMDMMRADIDLVRHYGLGGVVLGISREDGRLDAEALQNLIGHAQGLGLTLHRAFDLVPDFNAAIDTAVQLGFERILTSGGARSGVEGLTALEGIVAHAGDRISIMPGAGVNATNAGEILARLGVHEIHSSGGVTLQAVSGKVVELGFDNPTRRVTSREMVAAIKAAITSPTGN
ncbi:copper homeostasis protein CutC [Devosia sp. 2618]|uniref:copper homeostasis protein CutC n=1 Tax=Devosia sp. 2618 TaxID=3156454 RepID=UPI003394B506